MGVLEAGAEGLAGGWVGDNKLRWKQSPWPGQRLLGTRRGCDEGGDVENRVPFPTRGTEELR